MNMQNPVKYNVIYFVQNYECCRIEYTGLPVYITITCTLKRKLPRYSWNIVESGVKHHNTSLKRTGQI